jgi:hypothetical protein
LPTADREGEIIAGGLGTKHAMLLAHHGLLAAGRSVRGGVSSRSSSSAWRARQLDAAKSAAPSRSRDAPREDFCAPSRIAERDLRRRGTRRAELRRARAGASA